MLIDTTTNVNRTIVPRGSQPMMIGGVMRNARQRAKVDGVMRNARLRRHLGDTTAAPTVLDASTVSIINQDAQAIANMYASLTGQPMPTITSTPQTGLSPQAQTALLFIGALALFAFSRR